MHLQSNNITKQTNKSSVDLHFDTFSITLSEYGETMYPKGDEGGYISVATKDQHWKERNVPNFKVDKQGKFRYELLDKSLKIVQFSVGYQLLKNHT